MSNIEWEKETKRCKVQIVSSSNWKGGIPIDKKIRKWLVKIIDKFTLDVYCPTDHELVYFVPHAYDEESLEVIKEAFVVKEEHNKANLKNPEVRHKESQFRALINGIKKRRRRS